MPNHFRSFILVVALLGTVASGASSVPTPDEAYQDAKAGYSELKSDPAKRKFRHHWLNAGHKFDRLASKWPKSDRAPEALFVAAELYSELWRFSKEGEDLGASEAAYRKVCEGWPQHPLADDAALGLARLLADRREDPEAARKVIETALELGGGDKKAELKKLLLALPEPGRKSGHKDEESKKTIAKAAEGDERAEKVVAATRPLTPPGVNGGTTRPAAKTAGASELERLMKAVAKIAAQPIAAKPAAPKDEPSRLGAAEEDDAVTPRHARRIPALRPEGDGEEAREEGGEAKGGALDALKLPRLADLQERLRDVRVGAAPPPIRVADSVARARLKQAAKDGANSELTLAEQLGLKMRRVVIDAGHGGHDSGAIGPTGLEEKDVTLKIALQVAKKLEAAGLEVFLTRDDDTFVRLEDRAQFANQRKGDLFVSIHCNAAPNKTLRGIETYTLNTSADRYSIRLAARENATSERGVSDLQFILADLATKANTEESSRLARRVQKSLVKDLSAQHKGIRDLGTKEALFFVLLGARMPAILVETSFLSHPEEEKLLRDDGYQSEVAASISDAVTGFLEEREAKLARVD